MEKLRTPDLDPRTVSMDIDEILHVRGVDDDTQERQLTLGNGQGKVTIIFRGEKPSPGDSSDRWIANVVGNIFAGKPQEEGNLVVRISGVEAWQARVDEDLTDLVDYGANDWSDLMNEIASWTPLRQNSQAA